MKKTDDTGEKRGLFSDVLKKTADMGKKAADGVQKGVKVLSEQAQKSILEQKMKKYNPLFPKDFKSKNFKIPNIIEIVDDAVRRNIDVCEGAIGWTDKINDVEILHLYDEWVEKSGIEFVPVPKCDEVYYVDSFDRNRFLNANAVFSRTSEEKLAELVNIAYLLGAKSCSVEIVEAISESASVSSKVSEKTYGEASGSASVKKENWQSGRATTYFEGNRTPQRPPLKWFAHDDNIVGLIEMRCSDSNSIKAKVLELRGVTSTTMSIKVACAIDSLKKLKGSLSMEKQAIKEHNSRLIFEVEF